MTRKRRRQRSEESGRLSWPPTRRGPRQNPCHTLGDHGRDHDGPDGGRVAGSRARNGSKEDASRGSSQNPALRESARFRRFKNLTRPREIPTLPSEIRENERRKWPGGETWRCWQKIGGDHHDAEMVLPEEDQPCNSHADGNGMPMKRSKKKRAKKEDARVHQVFLRFRSERGSPPRSG